MSLPPVAVDFECYYDKECSIVTLGDAYFRHPKYFCYLVAIGDGENSFVGDPREVDWKSLKGRKKWSHNAGFDRRVYHYLRLEMLALGADPEDWPDLDDDDWNCTANLSVYMRGGRSLKSAVANLLGAEISKDVRDKMKGLMPEDMARTTATTAEYPTLWDEVVAYADKDKDWCLKLALKYGPDWPEFEQALSLITIQSCHSGVPVDVDKLEWGKNLMEEQRWHIEQRLPWVKEGHAPTSPKALAEWCRKAGIPCPPSTAKDDEDFIAWGEEYGEQYPWVENITNWRRANKMLKSVGKLLERQHDGTYSYGLKYGGAHTLRWSGDSGFNMQNPEKKEVLGFNLRHCFRAEEDHVFITADLAQIEARITPYLAGDWETIEAVANGMSIYEIHARQTMGWTGGVLKKENPTMYALAKARVLALGFGCGWQKFIIMAATEKFGRIILEPRKAREQVKEFRSRPFIPKLWNRLENDFRSSVGGDYELELPSGRIMRYFDVKAAGRKYTVDNAREGEVSEKTRVAFQARTEMGGRASWFYGGKLCENLVQATARDAFGEVLLRVKRNVTDARLLFHVHDEATWQVPKRGAKEIAEEIQRLLCVTPDWLPDCPIGAETTICDKYEK